MMRSATLVLTAIAGLLLGNSVRAQVAGPRFLDCGQPSTLPMPGASLDRVVRRLLDPPPRGLESAIPAGTRLLGLSSTGSRATVRLSRELVGANSRRLELAVEQIVKTVVGSGFAHVFIEVPDEAGTLRPLDWFQDRPKPGKRAPRLPGVASFGALAGKTIFVSPGHGYYWHSTLGWTTQRPTIGGLTEDIHTNEIAMRFLIPYLENMGATVISCRERGEIRREVIADNDQGWPVYRESGGWTTSTYSGYNARTYRFATTTTTSTAKAYWTISAPASGSYPVWVWYVAGGNRCPAARYEIHHSGGTSVVILDQTKRSRTWVHLGDFWFEKGKDAVVVLDNKSTSLGGVVIADAVRFGSGLGSIVRGSSTSGKPRWQECSRYWAQYQGAPSSVWNSSTNDHNDDVTCRPRYAEWLGGDAYLSLHTNAGGGTGTSSYIHNTKPSPGSAAFQKAVHTQVVSDIRAEYDSTWVDRGRKSANFGEVRLLSTMPGVLVELAFHDVDKSRDHNALHDPRFRRIAARGLARGVLRYFQPYAAFPPEPPEAVRVVHDDSGGLTVLWDPVVGATVYSIEQSPDGKGFVEVAQASNPKWSTGPLPHRTVLSFRVRALNSSGRSLPTEVLTAGTSHTGTAELLLVQGFDRLGKFVKSPENTRDYLRLHGDAIVRAAEFSVGFDAASNEAVTRGRLSLAGYRAVDWLLGEESTRDESFSTSEQTLVRGYLAGGGRLLVSGSEIGWDLDQRGTTTDRAFYHDVLGARYVRDDAATYAFRPVAGSVFAGLASGVFDDGTHGTYDVDYPDVVVPSDARSTPALYYGTGSDVAAIQRVAGQGRVVYLGFPLETVVDAGLRAGLMQRALRFLLSPRALELDDTLAPGNTLPISLTLPQLRGQLWVLAASGATHPGIALGGGRSLPLNPDPLFAVSLGANNAAFQGFVGVFDSSGNGKAAVHLPNDVRFKGIRFFVSGATFFTGANARLGPLLPWFRVN